ncbi:hypothetical protein N7456_002982 [Penicillium angulare]|uniref:Uncharacterized protein n=1 Tax=Penicillium angulare TaxID=116970 RepID=A0A9W9KIC1_9EURO|nr:hypothetical protein N7456_002982 [Penicillium angulare]
MSKQCSLQNAPGATQPMIDDRGAVINSRARSMEIQYNMEYEVQKEKAKQTNHQGGNTNSAPHPQLWGQEGEEVDRYEHQFLSHLNPLESPTEFNAQFILPEQSFRGNTIPILEAKPRLSQCKERETRQPTNPIPPEARRYSTTIANNAAKGDHDDPTTQPARIKEVLATKQTIASIEFGAKTLYSTPFISGQEDKRGEKKEIEKEIQTAPRRDKNLAVAVRQTGDKKREQP